MGLPSLSPSRARGWVDHQENREVCALLLTVYTSADPLHPSTCLPACRGALAFLALLSTAASRAASPLPTSFPHGFS
eukprot:53380-Chlamydomonas_euryale.AAC.1